MIRTALFLTFLLLFSLSVTHAGQDMREIQTQVRQEREALLERARQEKEAAEREAAEAAQRIRSDRRLLVEAVSRLEQENQQYKEAIEALDAKRLVLGEKNRNLDTELEQTDLMIRELLGIIRITAKDAGALVNDSFRSRLAPENTAALKRIAGNDVFPGMDDVRMMSEILFNEIHSSGNVRLDRGLIIDRSGQKTEAEILVIGNFTAAYRSGRETGFLNHTPAGENLFALSRLPSGRMQSGLADYMDGKSMAVPMDISRGGALRQLTHEMTLWDQIPKGGPIVWPILAILALGLAIVVERVIFLLRRRFDADSFIRQIDGLVKEGGLEACREACEEHGGKPVARIIGAGLSCCQMPREEMENALQEAILKEIPPMERYLSTLGMLAAIAPLLGLLGTVTGMINTFHVITLYGTGDPRMMSGGISEALVTTMMGLSVAIPLLMAHTWLNRAVDKNIGEMEEKAVALVNIADRTRGGHHHHHHHEAH